MNKKRLHLCTATSLKYVIVFKGDDKVFFGSLPIIHTNIFASYASLIYNKYDFKTERIQQYFWWFVIIQECDNQESSKLIIKSYHLK